MPEIQSIHYVYKPQPTAGATPAPGAQPVATWPAQPNDQWGGTPTYGQVPGYGQVPDYGNTPAYGQMPGYPAYPGYPTTPPGQQSGLAAMVRPVVTGAIAGLRAIGGVAFKTVRRTRSRNSYYSGAPRGYGSSYATRGYRSASRSGTRSRGGAKVGMSGNFTSRMWGAVKSSVVIGSIISVVMNGYDMAKNRITFAQAGSNVVGDVMSSAVGGLGGAVASSMGTAMLAGIVGTGFGATLVSLGLGIGGYMLTDYLFRKTNFFQKVTTKVHEVLA